MIQQETESNHDEGGQLGRKLVHGSKSPQLCPDSLRTELLIDGPLQGLRWGPGRGTSARRDGEPSLFRRHTQTSQRGNGGCRAAGVIRTLPANSVGWNRGHQRKESITAPRDGCRRPDAQVENKHQNQSTDGPSIAFQREFRNQRSEQHGHRRSCDRKCPPPRPMPRNQGVQRQLRSPCHHDPDENQRHRRQVPQTPPRPAQSRTSPSQDRSTGRQSAHRKGFTPGIHPPQTVQGTRASQRGFPRFREEDRILARRIPPVQGYQK